MMNTVTQQKEQLLNNLEQLNWKIEEGEDFAVIYESNFPYIYIRFTEDVKEPWDEVAYTKLHNEFGTSFFAVTDGSKAVVYNYNFGYGFRYTDIHSVEQFLSIPATDLWNYDIYRRIDETETLFEKLIVDQFIDFGIISPKSDNEWQKMFIEFANALFYEQYEPTGRNLPIEIVEDLMLDYNSLKNASGGGYEGLHRKFLVKLPDQTNVPFIISLFATGSTVNHPVYGNRKGCTQLNIAMFEKSNSTYNLQVNLDKFIDAISSGYEIWHNGIRSHMKKEYVLQTVKENADFLMDGDRIKLGRFPLNSTIDTSTFSNFIENIISYSYCRKLADMKYK